MGIVYTSTRASTFMSIQGPVQPSPALSQRLPSTIPQQPLMHTLQETRRSAYVLHAIHKPSKHPAEKGRVACQSGAKDHRLSCDVGFQVRRLVGPRFFPYLAQQSSQPSTIRQVHPGPADTPHRLCTWECAWTPVAAQDPSSPAALWWGKTAPPANPCNVAYGGDASRVGRDLERRCSGQGACTSTQPALDAYGAVHGARRLSQPWRRIDRGQRRGVIVPREKPPPHRR